MSTISCPNCNKSTQDARFCQYCGEPFFQADVSKGPRSACSCGTPSTLGATYCPKCGGTLAVEPIQWKAISGQGTATAMPDAIRGWNWGAFLLPPIWGLGNRTYIALLALVPLLNWVWPFVMGAKGNEWAWQNKKWDSIDHFTRIQERWTIAGLIIVLTCIIFIVSIPFILR
ncbi:MAG: hypothetical protein DDT32_01316 [Syntrophomonadaceae bacterium]|nr:hypothetical protein [Bacillota bacterium]MBT9147557.1 hypothetical protein [Bacillota bacterium]